MRIKRRRRVTSRNYNRKNNNSTQMLGALSLAIFIILVMINEAFLK